VLDYIITSFSDAVTPLISLVPVPLRSAPLVLLAALSLPASSDLINLFNHSIAI
jgi:hypothetical protein